MSLVDQRSGCKVGWLTYDNEEEAKAAAERARSDARAQARRGYDFGYCVPGEITHRVDHPEHGEIWVVTIP